MSQESLIRLPSRLVGVVRSDPPAKSPVNAPVQIDQAATAAAESNRELERVLAGLTQATRVLAAQKQQMLKEVESCAIELALTIAGQFLRTKVQGGDFPFEAWIREAVSHMSTRGPITVSMHPDDLTLLQNRLGENPVIAERVETVLTADASLTRGSCRARTHERGAYFDLEAGLARLGQELRQRVK